MVVRKDPWHNPRADVPACRRAVFGTRAAPLGKVNTSSAGRRSGFVGSIPAKRWQFRRRRGHMGQQETYFTARERVAVDRRKPRPLQL